MPGPGKPRSMAEVRAGAGGPQTPTVNPRVLQQQVLVAVFPNEAPEVYVAWANQTEGDLCLREASVGNGGDVVCGGERKIKLTDVARVTSNEGVVLCQDNAGRVLVQMHLETPEDESAWTEGLRAMIRPSSPSAGAGRGEARQVEAEPDSDLTTLHAQSRNLQSKIESLEAVSGRRDKQLKKMVSRLDGAMQMLTAVQDMCNQQRNVIQAQRTAITELQHDCGIEVDEDSAANGGEEDADRSHVRGDTDGVGVRANHSSPGGDDVASEDVDDVDDADMQDKEEQMMALLQQADEMQRMLQMLEAAGAAGGAAGASGGDDDSPPAAAPTRSSATRAAPVAIRASAEAAFVPTAVPDTEQDGSEEDAEAVLERLEGLEEEKRRFEGMLKDSQSEHEELLGRLTEMRTLMSALGLPEDGDDDDDGGEAGA